MSSARVGRSGSAVILAMAFALVLAACGTDDPDPDPDTDDTDVEADPDPDTDDPDPDPDTDAAAPDAGDGDTVTIAMVSDVSTLDGGMQSGWHEIHTLANIYDGLTRRGTDGSIEESIATDWELSDDGLVWTLQIREGVMFHNGDEMTAEDVAFTINRYADPEFPGQQQGLQYGNTSHAEVVDDWTVEIHNESPEPLFMQTTPTFSSIINQSIAEDLEFEEYGQSPETAVGTGPYRIVEWIRDDRMVLEAFEDHWRGEPEIKNVIIRSIPDRAAAVAALRAGEVDIVEALSVEQIELLEDIDFIEARTATGTGRQRLILNAENGGPFESEELRAAVNYAIDVDAIVDGVLLGFGEPIPSYGIPGVEVFAHDGLELYGHDPDRARELVAEAGFPDGIDIEQPMLVRDGYPKAEEVTQAIAAQLREVGINVDIQVLTSADFVRVSSDEKETFDIAFTGHGGGGSFHVDTGMTSLFHCERGSSTHRGFFCTDEVAQSLDDALQALTEGDEDAARDHYYNAQEVVYDGYGMGALWAQPFIFGVNSDLNFDITPDGDVWMYNASWS